ncbi:MAG: GTPase Era [Anaeroplasma bactoclasticum]|nr:GTPase Era [Anaeroplasma bactoclasticum]MCM1556489.1 GTPase Era [Anaeroplasma bactoclasticum]
MQIDTYKSGFVAVIGRPNVGKSTFVNQMVGKKVAIISSKPQTTRNRILGILTTEEYQIAFTDTPGIHKAKTELARRMVHASYDATSGVDCILFMTTPVKQVLHGDEIILENLKKSKLPVFLVINKVDQLKKFNDIDLTIALYKDLYPFAGVYPISVLENKNLDHLLEDILKVIPFGPKYYPDDMASDHSNLFLIAEAIREKVLNLTDEEIPHSIACIVDQVITCPTNEAYKDVYVTIYVERESQKKIIIGKNGAMIKQIKERSLMDVKKILDSKVHLELWVKVKKDWKDRPTDLSSLGYNPDHL